MNPPAYTYPAAPEREARTFNDYENPFAFGTTRQATVEADQERGGRTSSSENKTSTTFYDPTGKRHGWNTIMRGIAFLATLAAVLALTLTDRKVKVKLDNDVEVNANYKFSGAFLFFLYTNGIVCVYASVLSIMSLVMHKAGGGSHPRVLLWPVYILDLVACFALLLAFAAALPVELISRHGMQLTTKDLGIRMPKVCEYFETLCTTIDIALAASAVACINMIGGACIDSYEIFMFRI